MRLTKTLLLILTLSTNYNIVFGSNWYIGAGTALNLNYIISPEKLDRVSMAYYMPTLNHSLLFKKNSGEKLQAEIGILRLKTGLSLRGEDFAPFPNTMLAIPLNFYINLFPLNSRVSFYVTAGATAGYSIKQDRSAVRHVWALGMAIRPAVNVFFKPFYFAANTGYGFNINVNSKFHFTVSSNFLTQINKPEAELYPEKGLQLSGGVQIAGYYNFGKYNEPKVFPIDTAQNKKNFKNAVALDLLGVAGAYSLNYERILFKRKLMRIATNIGIEYIPTHAVFFPASSYGIFGYSPHYLEAGIGILSGYFLGSYMANFEKGTDGGYVATDQVYVPAYYQATAKMMLIGYRFEHTKGFLFKIRYTPYLERQRFFTGEKGLLFYHHFGGISIGWAF